MKERCIATKQIYDGSIIRVCKDVVELEDGSESIREVVHNSGGVCVLGIDTEGNFIFVKQFRYPFEEVLIECAGGKFEEQESILDAAVREFREETGYVSDKVSYLGYMYPTVAYCSEIIHMALIEDCVYEQQQLDDGEFVDVVVLSKQEVLQMIYTNALKDAKSIIAFFKYLNRDTIKVV